MLVRRAARGLSILLGLALLGASGCADEIGGDGWVAPANGRGGAALGQGGDQNSGGMMAEAGAPGENPGSGGKGGKGGRGGGGTRPNGGSAGSSTSEEGMGGETGGAVCGNGVTEAPAEDCDDGNAVGNDSCPANCSKACETCENTYCTAVRSAEAGEHGMITSDSRSPKDLQSACFDMPGLAEGGPAQGIARSELCQEMVDCIRREKCEQIVPDDFGGYTAAINYAFTRCYCDVDVTDGSYLDKCKSPDTFVPGKCKRQIQEASERDDTGTAFNGLYSGAKPLGTANLLLQSCDKKLCTEECLPSASSGVVAQITADILGPENAAGESALGNLIAEAQRVTMGTDFAFVNDFTFFSDFGALGLRFSATPGRPADAEGRVLESEVLHVLFGMDPVQNAVNQAGGSKLVTMKLTGEQVHAVLNKLRSSLNVSGLTYTWDAALPSSSSVTEVKKGGVAIDKSATYSVTVNDYLAQSIVGGTDIVVSDKSPARVLIEHLKAQPQPIAPPALNRVTRLN